MTLMALTLVSLALCVVLWLWYEDHTDKLEWITHYKRRYYDRDSECSDLWKSKQKLYRKLQHAQSQLAAIGMVIHEGDETQQHAATENRQATAPNNDSVSGD